MSPARCPAFNAISPQQTVSAASLVIFSSLPICASPNVPKAVSATEPNARRAIPSASPVLALTATVLAANHPT